MEGKRILKARPKVYLAYAFIRNAVLLKGEEILADAAEVGLVVETTVYRHSLAYYPVEIRSPGARRPPKVGITQWESVLHIYAPRSIIMQ